MVETVLDPIRMPTITLSEQELDDIEAQMAKGELPPDWLDRYYAAVQGNVFGVDHKKDRHGNPIEQGLGSAGNQTQNSINAFKKYCRDQPDYAETVKRMEAELGASNEVRKAAAAARRNRASAGARR